MQLRGNLALTVVVLISPFGSLTDQVRSRPLGTFLTANALRTMPGLNTLGCPRSIGRGVTRFRRPTGMVTFF